MESIGVAKAVNSLERNFQSAPPRPCLKGFNNGSRFQHATRRPEPQENLSIGAISRDLREVVVNRGTNRIRQWELQCVARLTLADAETAASPLDVIQCKGYDITRTQAISCHQRKDGIVALPNGGVPVDRTKQLFNPLTTEENVGAALGDRLADCRSLRPVRRELSHRRPGNEGSFASWQWVSARRRGPFAGPDAE